MNISRSLLSRLTSNHGNSWMSFSRLKLIKKQTGTCLAYLQNSAVILKTSRHHRNCIGRTLSTFVENKNYLPWCESSDKDTENIVAKGFKLIQNFITEDEEESLIREAEKHLKRTRYEYDHWDNVRKNPGTTYILVYSVYIDVHMIHV